MFEKEKKEVTFFHGRDYDYQKAVSAEFQKETIRRAGLRFIFLGSSTALGFGLSAEQFWQMMVRKFGFSSSQAYRTEVIMLEDSMTTPGTQRWI